MSEIRSEMGVEWDFGQYQLDLMHAAHGRV